MPFFGHFFTFLLFLLIALLEIDADAHPVIRSVDYQEKTLETLKKGNIYIFPYINAMVMICC